VEVLRRTSVLDAASSGQSMEVPGEACWKMCFQQLSHSFEPQLGGFGKAPKFPQPVNINFLFHVYSREPSSERGKRALDMCLHTLKMMAKGGIHDHVSQVRLKQVLHGFQGCMSIVELFCVFCSLARFGES
jgi:uncharacterized protein YyaL (SSP411 family)